MPVRVGRYIGHSGPRIPHLLPGEPWEMWEERRHGEWVGDPGCSAHAAMRRRGGPGGRLTRRVLGQAGQAPTADADVVLAAEGEV